MPRTPEQQLGLDFEKEIAHFLGGAVVPGSGNKFYAKNDVVANGFSISAKNQNLYSLNEIKRYLQQSIEDSFGSGSIPTLVIRDNDYKDDFVIMRLSDLVKAFSDGIKIDNSKESKGLEKRKQADIPLMLR